MQKCIRYINILLSRLFLNKKIIILKETCCVGKVVVFLVIVAPASAMIELRFRTSISPIVK